MCQTAFPNFRHNSGMPKKRSQSRTIDLTLPLAELRALVKVAREVADLDAFTDTAVRALGRLQVADWSARETVSDLERDAVQEIMRWLRPEAARRGVPELTAAVAKVEARLVSKVGKRANLAEWQRRAEKVRVVRAALRDIYGDDYEPTYEQVGNAIGETATAVRQWRFRHPELFDPIFD